jgi:hypothetical protein
MNPKFAGFCITLAIVVTTMACQKSSPARPTDIGSTPPSASMTDALSGITLTSPTSLTPADAQRFAFGDQPLTLTMKNAVSTGSTALTYTFQVATDSGFASIVFSKTGVAEGANGQTSVKIDKLAGGRDYFWRARATSGSQAGPFSKARSFNVGPEAVLQTPVLVSPSHNSTASGSSPTLSVTNVGRSGSTGRIVYRFELSDSSSFGNLIQVLTVAEQPNQTSASIAVKLTTNATYFWRVQASDTTNGITSSHSSVFSFKYVPFDMRQASIVNSPFQVASWAQTARITSVDFTGGAMIVDFDKRNGPSRWPDTPFGIPGDSLQYTLGICLNINGHWYCSAAIQYWHGRDPGASAAIARDWFYDARWGAMAGYQPSEGETVGIFVCAGNCRNNTAGDNSNVQERSNVELVPFTRGTASHRF